VRPLNEHESELWILYRVIERHCCANCKALKDKSCFKGNVSLKALEHCSLRDNCSMFLYGSTCSDWR